MKDALEQAFVMGRSMGKQGLVAWGVFEGNYLHDMFFTGEEAQELAELKGSHAKVRPLYDAPQQQEPVAIALNTGTKQGVKWLKNVEHGLPLYTTPPAEPDWKDLYEKQKRRAEMWIAKYEKDIGPLEKAVPVAQEPVHNVTSNGRYSPLLTRMMNTRTTPQQQEPRNFCPRCGKRTEDIHTCTPPEGGHQ